MGPEVSRCPVVLVHGWHGWPRNWQRIQAGLGARGYPCFTPRLPLRPWQAGIREDARLLMQFLRQAVHAGRPLADQPVVLVGYSRGGLVARALLRLYGTDGVRGVALVGVPNAGCPWGGLRLLRPLDGLQEMAEGSLFLRWLNQDLLLLRQVPHLAICGRASHHGGPNDLVVWEQSATLAGRMASVHTDLLPGTDAWHGNQINRAWLRVPVPGFVSNDRCWPRTLDHLLSFLAGLG